MKTFDKQGLLCMDTTVRDKNQINCDRQGIAIFTSLCPWERGTEREGRIVFGVIEAVAA